MYGSLFSYNHRDIEWVNEKTDSPVTYIKYGQVTSNRDGTTTETPKYITAPQCEHIEHDYDRKEKIFSMS